MNILIVNPPAYKGKEYIREGRCMQAKGSWSTLWPPLTLTYINAILNIFIKSLRLNIYKNLSNPTIILSVFPRINSSL